uniref:Uncharacterized protein n=1 Tax=Chromera velia CCMP2878 TaxID=1169474 RepID=A0A0G4GBG3_9ALVE|eukprot:Cvel_21012.t1-p1 / transcript=Cvel_21012.t1 / gene=Cvel_21012 / organism=Chromera_velia_CCMP2878 / gene_product=hypothetical protein / transcript_product=hypothetical protein / location=Cvel_scaffold1936:24084-27703(-) / protein_length=272 / sequence_SO=supercontig / SO=protein_coding / is_pseudo=false
MPGRVPVINLEIVPPSGPRVVDVEAEDEEERAVLRQFRENKRREEEERKRKREEEEAARKKEEKEREAARKQEEEREKEEVRLWQAARRQNQPPMSAAAAAGGYWRPLLPPDTFPSVSIYGGHGPPHMSQRRKKKTNRNRIRPPQCISSNSDTTLDSPSEVVFCHKVLGSCLCNALSMGMRREERLDVSPETLRLQGAVQIFIFPSLYQRFLNASLARPRHRFSCGFDLPTRTSFPLRGGRRLRQLLHQDFPHAPLKMTDACLQRSSPLRPT